MKQTKPIFLCNPPPGFLEEIERLLASADVELSRADSEDAAAVCIIWVPDKLECGDSKLYVNGYMTCPSALEAAERLGVDRATFGKLLNLLDIKLRQCQLGCF